MTKDGEVFLGLSNKGAPFATNAKVDDAVKLAEAALGTNAPRFSGQCAEMNCLAQMLNAGKDTEGAVFAAARVADSQLANACAVCQWVLKYFGATSVQ